MNSLTRLIPKEEYEKNWQPIHMQVFVNQYPPGFPFKNHDWKVILVPHSLNFDETVFHALASLAKKEGDTELVVDTWEVLDGSQSPIAIPWNYLGMLDAIGSLRSHFENHLYGKSGVWGISCSNEHDLSYFGGAAEFSESLVAGLGGIEEVKRSFMLYNLEFARYEKKFLENLLRNVGWEEGNWGGEDKGVRNRFEE